MKETGGLLRVLKSFSYGAGTTAPDYSKGKLKTAKRFNYVGAPFNATVEVRDTYVYGGRGGRASQNDTEMFFNDAPAEGFRQSPTWDNLGNLASQGYPDCFTGSCAALDTPRTVSFTYSYGHLATVPGFTGSATTTTGTPVNQITYHPNGMVHQVPHANQMLYTAGRDLWGMARPSSFQANRGSTIYWNTGTHTYDGAGNLQGTGEFNVAYDTLSRVLRMSTMLSNSQSYTYDLYGNVQSVTTNASLVNTPTSSATNHLSAGTYDGAGSLFSWAGNTYEHDAFGQLKRYVAGAEDWRYVYTAGDERFWSYRAGGGGSLWTLRGLDGQVLRRYESHVSWGTYEDYVYRDGQLLAAALTPTAPAPRTGMWHFHLDHLGTPRMVTNQNGGSIGFHRYYPFGQEETALQEGEVRKFTGHERDLASLAGTADDLDYMHARHFSPLTTRFYSFDPIGGNPRVPQSWNRYAYVLGNPLKYTDPYGLYWGSGIRLPTFYAMIEVVCTQPAGGPCVPSQNHSNTQGNTLTGITGLNSLNFGSAFFNGLSSLGSDLTVLRPSDFSLGRTAQVSGMGLAAFTDGVIPFADPFEEAGVYDAGELGLEHSQKIGEVTRDLEIALASTGSTALFGKGTWLNRGQYFRIGHSASGKVRWFSVRGKLVDRATGVNRAHIDLWSVGRR